MTDDPQKFYEMLERATAPSTDTPADLDAETAALRGGWLGLCKLIEGEEHPFAQPTNEHVVEVVETAPSAPLRKRSARSRWIAPAVAASLLIAAGITLAVYAINRSNAPHPSAQEIVKNDHPIEPPTRQTVKLTPKSAPNTLADARIAATTDRLQWGDSVDDEITAVGKATTLAEQDWYTQSSGVVSIQSGIDDLEQEMNQRPL